MLGPIRIRPRIVTLAIALGGPVSLAPSAVAQCTEGCTAIHVFEGEAAGDQLGWVSNDLADLTGDGVRELVLTAPTNDAGGTNAGRIYVHDGATGQELWRVTGGAPGWWLGHDAIGAGDVDGDGLEEVIVGAPFAGRGRAQLHSGADGSLIRAFVGAAPGDQLGFRVDGGGDVDGDGVPDLVVGAPNHDATGTDAGRVYVYSGATFQVLGTADGDAANDAFGSGVAMVGDLNGDGRADVAVGAQNAGAGDGGRAYAYTLDSGQLVRLFAMDAPAPRANLGQWFMNGGHDATGDGVPDVYVNDFAVNRAHLFSGADGSLVRSYDGEGEGGQFGIGRLVEDVDGDCLADLVLAAWISGQGAPNAGKAFIYSGRDGALLDAYTHDVPGAGFGFDANGMGDVDGDGVFDWLVTAASDLSSRGRAYVLAGRVTAPPTGDLDGDGLVGFSDLVTLLAQWGPCPAPPEACPGDVDCDRTTGFDDVLALLAHWS